VVLTSASGAAVLLNCLRCICAGSTAEEVPTSNHCWSRLLRWVLSHDLHGNPIASTLALPSIEPAFPLMPSPHNGSFKTRCA